MPPLHKENEKSKETISQNSFYPRYAREFMLKNKFNTNKEQINKNKGLSDLKDRKFFILLYMLFIIIPFLFKGFIIRSTMFRPFYGIII